MIAVAGFGLAPWHGWLSLRHLGAMLFGLAAVIASACVSNNYLDRRIDKLMTRTRKRALVQGMISPRKALLFAVGLLVSGIIALFLGTNWLTLVAALFGWVAYVLVYTFAKRHTVYSTLIGSISGAVPPVVGYTAATNRFDWLALSLFAILVAWQMPHFYAIAIYREKDYEIARLPVLTVVRGPTTARFHIITFIVLFMGLSLLPSVLGRTGYSYAVLLGAAGIWWLYNALKLRPAEALTVWARRIFRLSLIILLVLTAGWILGPRLP